MSIQALTANQLNDGSVIFLGYDGEWTRSIDEARLAERDDDVEDMLAEAKASGRAVGAYLIDVEVRAAEGARRFVYPTKFRERIRAFGPTTHPVFSTKMMPGHFDPKMDVSTAFANGI